jgi:phosphomannomutase
MSIDGSIFKAYDVRGTCPGQLDERVAHLIGRALTMQLGARTLAVGKDPRPTSADLGVAFATGAASAGAVIEDLGMVPTEMLYFGVASRGRGGGAMITASHNPRGYNGLKLVGDGALPLSGESGMPELLRRVQDLDAAGMPPAAVPAAETTEVDLYDSYVDHLMSFVEPQYWPDWNVVMDAANGAAGKLAPMVFDRTPLWRVEMYFDVDGTFPNHEPNPLLEENSRELRERVLADKADLGIAWDGDADRCFFVDETGEFVPGDFVTALLAEALLIKHPGAAILYDLRASRAVPDTIAANGGVPLMNRVGHAFFKQRMRREPVLFGGEVSGHYYFADNHNADSGFIPALLMLDLMARKKATLAELLEPLRTRYFISGEINSTVDDTEAVFARLRQRYADATLSDLDGVSVDYPDWHFNVRASNTEPLVRLNLGAIGQALMEEKRDEVLEVIRGG